MTSQINNKIALCLTETESKLAAPVEVQANNTEHKQLAQQLRVEGKSVGNLKGRDHLGDEGV
jgi:hypothetical protein